MVSKRFQSRIACVCLSEEDSIALVLGRLADFDFLLRKSTTEGCRC